MADQPTPERLTVSGTVEAHFTLASREWAAMMEIQRRTMRRCLGSLMERNNQILGRARMRTGARRWAKLQRRLRRGFPDIIGPAKEGT